MIKVFVAKPNTETISIISLYAAWFFLRSNGACLDRLLTFNEVLKMDSAFKDRFHQLYSISLTLSRVVQQSNWDGGALEWALTGERVMLDHFR